MIEWSTIIINLISVLLGGGIVSLFTLRERRRELQIENNKKEDDRWQKLVDEFQDDNIHLNERIDKKDARITELEDTNSNLRSQLDGVRTKCAISEILRCETVSCPSRVPPLGVRNLNVDKLVEPAME